MWIAERLVNIVGPFAFQHPAIADCKEDEAEKFKSMPWIHLDPIVGIVFCFQ